MKKSDATCNNTRGIFIADDSAYVSPSRLFPLPCWSIKETGASTHLDKVVVKAKTRDGVILSWGQKAVSSETHLHDNC